MPKITVTLPQAKYDAVVARTDAYNARNTGVLNFVPLTPDDYVDQFLVTPSAEAWRTEDDFSRRMKLRLRYEAAAPAIQAQVDALLPVIP